MDKHADFSTKTTYSHRPITPMVLKPVPSPSYGAAKKAWPSLRVLRRDPPGNRQRDGAM